MTKMLVAALAATTALGAALPAPLAAQMAPAQVAALRDAALKDEIAWDITEGLTTEIGPRLAGSDDEARARDSRWCWPPSATRRRPRPRA